MAGKKIGIIGGSGLYRIEGLEEVRKFKVDTPFGSPSGEFTQGVLDGTPVVFLPRHGEGHGISPSEINFRANIYALKTLGVNHLVSISAVGSMKEEIEPGDFLLVDQFIDRTRGKRRSTFFEDGVVGHVALADPVCGQLRDDMLVAAKKTGKKVHKRGTYLCVEGPGFSTRAESNLYRSWGVDVIGMTNFPEYALAREAEICYATLALVTDYDCWKEGEEDVTVDTVLKTLKNNVEAAEKFVKVLPSCVRDEKSCSCESALKYAIVTDPKLISAQAKDKLKPILGKYFPEGGKL